MKYLANLLNNADYIIYLCESDKFSDIIADFTKCICLEEDPVNFPKNFASFCLVPLKTWSK